MTPRKKALAAGGAADKGLENRIHNPKHKPSAPDCQALSSGIDLGALRDRLLATRARLLEQVANDWEPGRRYPDTSWCRMLSDVQGAIQALDAVVEAGGP